MSVIFYSAILAVSIFCTIYDNSYVASVFVVCMCIANFTYDTITNIKKRLFKDVL